MTAEFSSFWNKEHPFQAQLDSPIFSALLIPDAILSISPLVLDYGVHDNGNKTGVKERYFCDSGVQDDSVTLMDLSVASFGVDVSPSDRGCGNSQGSSLVVS
ncbi:hypothetical protein L2E82_24468 [Cichorium intybus]|uniref:Uncharacterized protein n=1 Tax=Cichorium intybus TaxID=13427 RepID=A0ACB9E144_CICIN|nr:hypothetical protein L2E82_24468 [Cichorium intybus]